MSKAYQSALGAECIKYIYLEGSSPWGFRIHKENESSPLIVTKVQAYIDNYFNINNNNNLNINYILIRYV